MNTRTQTIYNFECGICGKKEETTDFGKSLKWGNFKIDLYEIDICPECATNNFKYSKSEKFKNIITKILYINYF